MKNIISKAFTLFAVVVASVTANAVEKNQIVGGQLKRLDAVAPKTATVVAPKKKQDLLSRYKGSKQERALDEQIRRYRASAKENERVFGAPYRKAESDKKINKYGIFEIIIDAATGKKFYVPVKK